jgi:hypothetical protein
VTQHSRGGVSRRPRARDLTPGDDRRGSDDPLPAPAEGDR